VSDPNAAAKREQAVQTAMVLAAVFAAARTDVLRRLHVTGTLRDVLTNVWRDLLRTRVHERSLAVVQAVSPDVELARIEGKINAYADWFATTWDESIREALAQVDVLAQDINTEVVAALDTVASPEVAKLRADSLSVEMGNFAAIEEAMNGGKATKTWRIQGATTRPSHLALEGSSAPIDGFFPNGLQYPGAPGPPEERVNCDCYLTFGEA
jgi:hypothetical protein